MTDKVQACDCSLDHDCVVDRVRAASPTEEELRRLEELFALVGDRTRTRILLALSVEEMCVGDLTTLLAMDKSAISHQLARLREAGLVASRKVGRLVYYSSADCHVNTLMALGLEHARGACHEPCHDHASHGRQG